MKNTPSPFIFFLTLLFAAGSAVCTFAQGGNGGLPGKPCSRRCPAGTTGWSMPVVIPGQGAKVVCACVPPCVISRTCGRGTSGSGSSCANPAIDHVVPSPLVPASTVTVSGCGFGPADGYVNLTSTAQIATSGGYSPEPPIIIQLSQGGGTWSDGTVKFELPAPTKAGAYTLSIIRPDGKKASAQVTVAAAIAAGSSLAPPTAVGWLNQQNGSFNTSIGAAFSITGSSVMSVARANPAPAGQVLASLTLQTAVPVSTIVSNPGSIGLVIWQDTSPVQSDPTGAQDGSPDGNEGWWIPVTAEATSAPPAMAYSCGNIGSAAAVSEPVILPPSGTEPNPGVSYIAAHLNPGTNYLAILDSLGDYCNLAKQYGSSLYGSSYPADMEAGDFVAKITVPPVLMVTLDAVPYTIIYQPPGDQSTASLVRSVTSSTQYTVGLGTQTSNSSLDAQNTCYSLNLVLTYQNCNSQETGSNNALAQQWGGSSLYSNSSSNTWTIGAINTLVPAPNTGWQGKYTSWPDTYWNEPFWNDGFVFLKNAQYAVYDDGGNPVFELVPQQNPDFSNPIPLAFLAACAAGLSTPSGQGFPVQQNACDIGGVVLSRQEALNALSFDPFYYPNSQATDPMAGCSSPQLCRAQELSPQDYSENIENLAGGLESNMTTSSSYVDGNATFGSTITSSQTTNAGLDLKVSISYKAGESGPSIGTNGEATATQGSSQSNTGGVTVTYQSSTVASVAQTRTDTVGFGDWSNAFVPPDNSSPKCTACHAQLSPSPQGAFVVDEYQDNLFGTLMFRESGAPPPPPTFGSDLKRMLPVVMTKMQPMLVRERIYSSNPPLKRVPIPIKRPVLPNTPLAGSR